jgi:hypothetical protein
MVQGQTATCIELSSGGSAAHVFARRHFAVILTEMRPGNRASQPRDIALRLVRAGAVLAVSFAMIDPFHIKARVEIVSSSRLVGVDDAASGDATTNDRDGLGLMFHHCRHGRAAPLTHQHDATALAAFVLASTPINASHPMVFWPDAAAKHLMQQGERGLRMQPQIAAHLKSADTLGSVDEQASGRIPNAADASTRPALTNAPVVHSIKNGHNINRHRARLTLAEPM